jgi:hypothetical protein
MIAAMAHTALIQAIAVLQRSRATTAKRPVVLTPIEFPDASMTPSHAEQDLKSKKHRFFC